VKASWEDVQEVAAWVAQPMRPTLLSTARTTTLLRISLRKASYQEDCITSFLSASADPADDNNNSNNNNIINKENKIEFAFQLMMS